MERKRGLCYTGILKVNSELQKEPCAVYANKMVTNKAVKHIKNWGYIHMYLQKKWQMQYKAK